MFGLEPGASLAIAIAAFALSVVLFLVIAHVKITDAGVKRAITVLAFALVFGGAISAFSGEASPVLIAVGVVAGLASAGYAFFIAGPKSKKTRIRR